MMGTHHRNLRKLSGAPSDNKTKIQARKNPAIGAFVHGHEETLHGLAESGCQFRHRCCQIMLRVVFASACSITVGNSPGKLPLQALARCRGRRVSGRMPNTADKMSALPSRKILRKPAIPGSHSFGYVKSPIIANNRLGNPRRSDNQRRETNSERTCFQHCQATPTPMLA